MEEIMPEYQYTIEGHGRHRAPYKTTGFLRTERPGDFPNVLEAMHDSYKKLTEGKATFGDLGTCQGPYTIQKVELILMEETNA
jgi:hypothetical protein